MNKRLVLWLAPTFAYLLFAAWYTNLSGPLSTQEIDTLITLMEERGTEESRLESLRKFMEEDTGKQFFMINALDKAENPNLPKGAAVNATSDDLMNHYMEHMYPALFSRASHPIYFGTAVADVMDSVGLNSDIDHWDQAAVFRYRSRRDMLEIAMNPAFSERHEYKLAALDKTLAYPTEAALNLGDPRFFLFFVLGFATALLDIFIFGHRKAQP